MARLSSVLDEDSIRTGDGEMQFEKAKETSKRVRQALLYWAKNLTDDGDVSFRET